ncbi:uncharacterized protein LOC125446251 [Zea mays]|uniref:uncharacterized protein LOC125446251 n=1 Tax=Zea mays TaxID=4577 RepID=UPI0002210485|nr:uncharacterized protein LOC125446251 [Zea mays]
MRRASFLDQHCQLHLDAWTDAFSYPACHLVLMRRVRTSEARARPHVKYGWIWQIRQEPSPSRSERKKERMGAWGPVLVVELSLRMGRVRHAGPATTVGTQDLPPPSFVLHFSSSLPATRLGELD